jgi:hypothetical protein
MSIYKHLFIDKTCDVKLYDLMFLSVSLNFSENFVDGYGVDKIHLFRISHKTFDTNVDKLNIVPKGDVCG